MQPVACFAVSLFPGGRVRLGLTCRTRKRTRCAARKHPAACDSRPGEEGARAEHAAAGEAAPPDAGERPISARELVDAFRKLNPDLALSGPRGSVPSYKLVKFDEDGFAAVERFVYVEEKDCIGCTHCATTAGGTFFIEESLGRARVFRQAGDSARMIEEAVDTCPVNCIYFTTYEDLVLLENERSSQNINNFTRLVGGQDSSSSVNQSKADINTSGIMRCTDCPHRGCADCPLYGVGENPAYAKRMAMREEKKKAKRRRDGSNGGSRIL